MLHRVPPRTLDRSPRKPSKAAGFQALRPPELPRDAPLTDQTPLAHRLLALSPVAAVSTSRGLLTSCCGPPPLGVGGGCVGAK